MHAIYTSTRSPLLKFKLLEGKKSKKKKKTKKMREKATVNSQYKAIFRLRLVIFDLELAEDACTR